MLLPSPLPAHPRLLARPADWTRLRQQVESDGPSRRIWETLVRRADAICTEPPVERTMTGRLLLMISRRALERVSVLAMVDRISDDRRYGARAIRELLALCRFTDWNPSHFLDTAELCLAVAIGYDWLFDQLKAEERDEIATALVEKGITPSLDTGASTNWWLKADENWVQVCHGGLCAAAIVLADRTPELSELILRRALDALPGVAVNYAPDGAYPEGPMYWSYGTSYHVVLAAALSRLTGDALGADAYPGFAASAGYINAMTAPSGDYFNYADCAPRRRLQPPLFWMAERFGHKEWLEHDLCSLDADLSEYEADPGAQYWYYDMVALALLWRTPTPEAPKQAAGDRTWLGGGPMPVATYRWGAGNLFLGIKGGSVGLSHSHMDVGSFVFEALGERWAIDTGMQDYESLESAGVDLWNERKQESQRWQVFRIGLDSHNIFRIDQRPQLLFRKAELYPVGDGCTVDVSDLYGPPVTTASRRFDLHADGFSVEDRWQATEEMVGVSQWLTFATAHEDGASIVLGQNGKQLAIEFETPGASIVVEDLSQPIRSFDAPNPGLKRLTIRSRPVANGLLRLRARAIGP